MLVRQTVLKPLKKLKENRKKITLTKIQNSEEAAQSLIFCLCNFQALCFFLLIQLKDVTHCFCYYMKKKGGRDAKIFDHETVANIDT